MRPMNSDEELENALNELLDEKYGTTSKCSQHTDSKWEQRKIAHAKIAKETSRIVSESWKQSFIKVWRLDSNVLSPEHHWRNSSNKLAKLVSMT